MIGRHVFYEGRVQGVGFRYTARHIAKGYDVTGWVKNLTDGRVEMQVSGEPDEVDAFLTAIDTSELGSFIRNKEVSEIDVDPGAKGFEIRFK
jgi:acylphosphatase